MPNVGFDEESFRDSGGPERIDYGPSFIPNADVRRNVCCPQEHQSQIGQEQPVGFAAEFAKSGYCRKRDSAEAGETVGRQRGSPSSP